MTDPRRLMNVARTNVSRQWAHALLRVILAQADVAEDHILGDVARDALARLDGGHEEGLRAHDVSPRRPR